MLPTAWNLYNLQSSPFWQDSLAHENAARPLTLFVGRTAELGELRTRILDAGARGSRQAVTGTPGVGKTTLVKALKGAMQADGYLTVDDFVPVVGDDTTVSLLGRVLALVYETILANRPATYQNAAMQAAELLVRSTRIATGGGGLSISGVGASVTKGTALSTPKDLIYDGPRVLRDLMTLVRGSGALGLVLHLNNLENLTAGEAKQSATEFRDLRDVLFMHDGLHIVVVGTSDAIQDVIVAHESVRHIFSVLPITPLAIPQVQQLLAARYAHLTLDHARPIVPPVDDSAVRLLVELYHGDLRGVLQALDDGVRPNLVLGATSTSFSAMGGAHHHVGMEALRATLQPRYAMQLGTVLDTRRIAHLTTWATRDASDVHTQASLSALWQIKQSAVSITLRKLTMQGYVIALPRQGNAAIEYVLSGTSRLIFD